MAKDLPEILPPPRGPELVQIWGWRVNPKMARAIKVGTALPLFAVAGWLLQNFLQLRGIVNLTASRIDLALLALCIFGVVCLWTIGSHRKRKSRIALGIAIFIIAFVIDWLAPKPQVTSIAHDGHPVTPEHQRPTDWRTIKDWQKAELAPLLEHYPRNTLHIIASSISDEVWDYASQFKDFFAAHRWKVVGPEAIPADQVALDMQLSVSEKYWATPRPDAFTAVDAILRSIGVKMPHHFVVDPLASPDELVMWIGPESPPNSPVFIPLQLGTVCRHPLQFTDDTMHFFGDPKDFVRWVRIKPPTNSKFLAGHKLLLLLTASASRVSNSEYYRVQALGKVMPRPDMLDVSITKDVPE